MIAQRDAFLNNLFEKAKLDSDIILIVVDMAASIIQKWQKELPDQFIYCGISEQHAINLASGLASQNKKVYIYFMAAWVCRCLEQIRYSICMPNYPITILGNGVGLGYAPAGPAHEPTEDIAYARSMINLDVLSISNNNHALNILNLTLDDPKPRYIRLERSYEKSIDEFDYTGSKNYKILKSNIKNNISSKTLIISCGFLLGRCLKAFESLQEEKELSLLDLFKLKNFNDNNLSDFIKNHNKILVVEEHILAGGLNSIVSEFCTTNNINIPIFKLGLPDKFIFENGTREILLDENGLSLNDIIKKLKGIN